MEAKKFFDLYEPLKDELEALSKYNTGEFFKITLVINQKYGFRLWL